MENERRSSGRRASRTRAWVAAGVLGVVLAVLSGGVLGLALRASSRSLGPSPLSEPFELSPTGSFTHPTAGFVMPEESGPFRRVAVTQYDEAGRDISAGYNAEFDDGETLPIAATVYVYPAGQNADLDDRFESLLRTLREAHDGAEVEFRKNVLLSDRELVARYAVLGYAEPWGGLTESVPLRSYVVLYEWKGWWVKWRATTPAPVDPKRMRAIVDLTQSLLPPMPASEESPGKTGAPSEKGDEG